MFKKILVAIDGSDVAKKALICAIEEAKVWDAKLHGLFVINVGVSQSMFLNPTSDILDRSPELINDLLVKEADDALNEAKQCADDAGIPIELHKEWGDARNEILNIAVELGADLIVMGSTGKTGLNRLLLGSVSSSVITNSKITTMVVRE